MGKKNRSPLTRIAGLFYGLALAFFSLWIMGAGHGTYVPFAVFSSPLGFAGITFGLSGTPIFWLAVGLLATNEGRLSTGLFLITIVVHYAAIPFLLRSAYGDWEYFFGHMKYGPIAAIIVASFLIYLVGQVRLWTTFIAGRRQETT